MAANPFASLSRSASLADRDLLRNSNNSGVRRTLRNRALEIFNLFDTDGTQSLDVAEFQELAYALGEVLTDEEAKECVLSIDTDKNGTISFDEFFEWWVNGESSSTGEGGSKMNVLRARMQSKSLMRAVTNLLSKVPKYSAAATAHAAPPAAAVGSGEVASTALSHAPLAADSPDIDDTIQLQISFQSGPDRSLEVLPVESLGLYVDVVSPSCTRIKLYLRAKPESDHLKIGEWFGEFKTLLQLVPPALIDIQDPELSVQPGTDGLGSQVCVTVPLSHPATAQVQAITAGLLGLQGDGSDTPQLLQRLFSAVVDCADAADNKDGLLSTTRLSVSAHIPRSAVAMIPAPPVPGQLSPVELFESLNKVALTIEVDSLDATPGGDGAPSSAGENDNIRGIFVNQGQQLLQIFAGAEGNWMQAVTQNQFVAEKVEWFLTDPELEGFAPLRDFYFTTVETLSNVEQATVQVQSVLASLDLCKPTKKGLFDYLPSKEKLNEIAGLEQDHFENEFTPSDAAAPHAEYKSATRVEDSLEVMYRPFDSSLQSILSGAVDAAYANEVLRDNISGHSNVVRVVKTYQNLKDGVILVAEAPAGAVDLFAHLQANGLLGEESVRSIAKQLVSLVEHIHREGYIHRDIKIENFVYVPTENHVLLAICDTICPMSDKLTRPVGTVYSCAPEIVTATHYGKECDLWSIGVLVYTLLTGALPFPGESLDEILAGAQQGANFDGPEWEGSSPEAADFVRQLLVLSPQARATIPQCLAHPFLQ